MVANKSKKESKKAAAANTNKRRNRVPISCTICRRRKVKCDKQRPVCTACNRTGVAHLCHYIDPPWAQPLQSNEIAPVQTNVEPESEVDKLKQRIRELESQLYHHNEQLPSPHEDSDERESQSSHEQNTSMESLPNESLNLGKKFDMLHIKSTTTVHLGATSWLAIMKGDPYLRVLWAHIFKMRKKVEMMKFKSKMIQVQEQQERIRAENNINDKNNNDNDKNNDNKDNTSNKDNNDTNESKDIENDEKGLNSSPKCPVSGRSGNNESKCPVSHQSPQSEPLKCPVVKPNSNTNTQSQLSQCPVQHNSSNTTKSNPQNETLDESGDKVCPLMIGDSSFLNGFNGQDQEIQNSKHDHSSCPMSHQNQHQHSTNDKKRKRSSNNSNDNSNNNGPKPKRLSKAAEKEASLKYQQNPVFMLESYLPKKKTLWLHIKRFFEVLYVYMPYVDEPSFIEELKFIFGEENDKDQTIKIKIRSGVDFALVGTVCLILRLSWHTLPMNNSAKLLKKSINSKNYQEDPATISYLQKPENEVQLKLVDCVKQCFSNLKLMRKSSLKIVQCGLFMRLYFMYSPDDGDGADGSDSQIFLGMIIQMAISIGLHRDPKNFENFSNERQRHLWRKIWFKLISLDVLQSMNLGCPRALQNHMEFSDTELPGDSEDGLTLEEFKNDLKELTIIKNIHTQVKIDDLIAKTMKVLLNSNKPARRFQVDQLIDQLEQCTNGFEIINDKYALPQIGKILVNRSKNEPLYVSGVRAIEFQLHVTVNMLLYLLNYILYVHFEPRGSTDIEVSKIAKNYAQKALNCALEGYRNCTLFFDCGLEYFGPGADIVLAPLLLLVGHRSMQFMVSLILRSRCGPFMKPSFNQKQTEEDLLSKATTSTFKGNKTKIEDQNDENDVLKGYNNIDNRNHDLDEVEIKDESDEFTSKITTSIFNVDVNSGEVLATILLKHMDSFHKLAETLGSKYNYSWRMGKAVGFFVTLLKKPINIVKDLVKTDNIKQVEKNQGVSNVLNSVPLVLSKAPEEDVNNQNNGDDDQQNQEMKNQAEDVEISKNPSASSFNGINIDELQQNNGNFKIDSNFDMNGSLFNPLFENLDSINFMSDLNPSANGNQGSNLQTNPIFSTFNQLQNNQANIQADSIFGNFNNVNKSTSNQSSSSTTTSFNPMNVNQQDIPLSASASTAFGFENLMPNINDVDGTNFFDNFMNIDGDKNSNNVMDSGEFGNMMSNSWFS
ncbi:hypothetical protein BN7_1978 [Wickerhamomyces ciferrii]|uniref:Zn(2)-C6 fungal-type domain-containing protein n=1 Tax=Wickerhamomyces ciferrii (strain ATCC 14091 / BCRC 22168 / CBS 111 / JCM 3599 / NBRC 0793 / NRRL Y-1031 F-60-10) TaxID=1206466 RepID=K0KMT4_WICCF|nr:uncharacterized protein BN7_1978 [Wickerhamomyces ciferrii]CCH42433.1 hypothetical protein BN7_1978 [Wickerhamomyces ciferrii]